MKKPILSIVIANYNYGRYLESAIGSVVSQDVGEEVELIVCDAASKDNSVDIIKKYAHGLPPCTSISKWEVNNEQGSASGRLCPHITWWCSEKDSGQSDAFNKGFHHANGEWITWLNADDILMPGCLPKILKRMAKGNCDWITGNFLRFNRSDKRIIEAKWGPHYLPSWMQGNGWPVAVFGPTTFWRKSIYDWLGDIRNDLHYSMDTEYWTRMVINGIKQTRLNVTCWAFGMHAESKTAEFDGHECSPEVKARQDYERDLRFKLHGYHESRIKVYLTWGWRILDGSAMTAFWRRVFLVGRKLAFD